MKKWFCDICGKETTKRVFQLPYKEHTGWHVKPNGGEKTYSYIPVDVNLCEECRAKIYELITEKVGEIHYNCFGDDDDV